MLKLILYPTALFCLLSGCTGSYPLSKHSLESKKVFINTMIPDTPFADFDMTIYDKVGKEIPVYQRKPEPATSGIPPLVVHTPDIVELVEEGAQTETHVLIDSVLANRSMSDQLVRYAEALSVQQFKFEPVSTESEADYKLNLDIHDYGIGADSWTTTVFFEISATITLMDPQTSKRIWEEEVHDLATVSKALLQAGMPQEQTQSPALLATKTYEEMDDLLSGLARYGAGQLTMPLREAYRHTIERERATLIENDYTVSNEGLDELRKVQ